MIIYLMKFVYEKFFKTQKTLLEEIEEDRNYQISLMESILLSIKKTSFQKKMKLEKMQKNKKLDMIILAHFRVLELNPMIREKGTKRMEARQRRHICLKYYTKQYCRFEECSFAHIAEGKFAKEYQCHFGQYCHILNCQFQHTNELKENKDSETMCGICHEDINNTNKRYGLLQNCDHVYCLDCIKMHRSGKMNTSISLTNRLKCPICRVHSRFVLPSKYNLKGEQKKKDFVRFYEKRKEKNCRNGINCSRINTCPFKH